MAEKPKAKQFRWETEMLEKLIEFIQQYKSEMEYKNLDFDGDRPAQYSWLRKKMSKLYDKDTSIFGPVDLTPAKSSLSAMSKKEIEAFTKQNKAENEMIRRGYQRIREKVKEIRQSFSQAVVNGSRSGSGKIVYEFYDKLVTIWGGSAATQPLSFGVGTEDFKEQTETTQEQEEVTLNDSIEPDAISADVEDATDNGGKPAPDRKRKSASAVPNLIDNKRKHLEKSLSAAQRDALLLNEAKEDSTFRKNLADATREATSSLTSALKDMSSCMIQLGNGLSRSIESMAQAVMAQMMVNSNAQPVQHNQPLYNSMPNIYSTPQRYPLVPQPFFTQPSGNLSNDNDQGEQQTFHQL